VIQQINLYQQMFRKQKQVFSAVAMLQLSALVVAIFAAIYTYHLVKIRPVNDELNKMTVQYKKVLMQIEIAAKKIPKQTKSKLLESEVARLSAELEHLKKVKQALATGTFGNVDGFSGYFEALAKGHVQGTWLTGIHIAEGGGKLNFNGQSIDPELVPVYLLQLSEEPAFHKRVFNILELNRSQDVRQYISFNVGTGG